MQNKKILYKIIMPFIVLLAMLQQGSVFSKTHLRDNKLTFKRQEFKISNTGRIALDGVGAMTAIPTVLTVAFGSAALAIAGAAGVKYRNDIQILFTENDHCVTHNQPYKGVSSKKNILFVSSGRKGSKEVAQCFLNWFKDRGATSFNHPPAKLNFAVKGKLTVTVPVKKGKKKIFIFDNMVLAQGHKGAFNNWWIGGVNCTVKRKGVIACLPEGYEHSKEAVCFNRAFDYISTIHIVSCQRKY